MKEEPKHSKLLYVGFFLLEKDGGLPSRRKLTLNKSVEARLPYVRKFHQYLMYTAFNEEP